MDQEGTGRPPRRGRPGNRAGRGERGRSDRRDRSPRRDSGNASFRVLSELSVLEKALSAGDFAKQRPPLEEIVRQLKPLRLGSLEGLDFNTRGRLLTTLLRVGRQKKPPEPLAPAAPPPTPAAPPAEAGTPADEAPQTAPVPAEAPPAAPAPEEEKLAAYREVMFLLGSAWRAVGDEDRAAPAFAASGRSPEEREPPKPAAAPSGDWREGAARLASSQRSRDAAKLHERHGSHAEAAQLYEKSGDLKSALRSFLAAKDETSSRRLLRQLKPEQFLPLIEKAGAYQLLMEHYVEAGRFEEVAKLYERARQFDQAAIAWEKAGKLGPARRAYERANQPESVERVRQLEVEKLIERGDRLGAAVLLIGAGKREQAVQTLSALPAAKAFRFMQKLKLPGEAQSLAKSEIAKAEAENRPAGSARWLEMLGEASAAADAWIRADRKDRALSIYEKAGEWQRAASLAEALGQREKAIELYLRVGDRTSADRVAAMPAPVAVAPPSGAPVALEGEGEEG